MKKILLMLTGGTICSFVNEDGFKNVDYKKAAPILLDNYKKNNTAGIEVEFKVTSPLNILSENMTLNQWNTLIKSISKVQWETYDGIIISHGTDTLAYTAGLLSILLAGCKIPVFMVSSNYSLKDSRANGNDNFKAAVELIANDIVPNVYITYKNSDGITYLHKGTEIIQCQNYTWDFYSKNMIAYTAFYERKETRINREMLIYKLDNLENKVLMIEPYLGIDYSAYNLDGKTAVLHGLYHSSTACVDGGKDGESISDFSVLSIINQCKEKNIGFYIAPFEKELFGHEAMYFSTGILLNKGAVPIVGMSKEVCYAKLVIACALFTEQGEIEKFVKENINGEMVY